MKARSRQGQGKVKAMSRQYQGNVKAMSRQAQGKVRQGQDKVKAIKGNVKAMSRQPKMKISITKNNNANLFPLISKNLLHIASV